MADHLQETADPQDAKRDRFLPIQKSVPDAIFAVVRVEFARAASRETAQLLCPCPSGAIHRRPARLHSSSFARYAESASLLYKGERMEVSSCSPRKRNVQQSPYPSLP